MYDNELYRRKKNKGTGKGDEKVLVNNREFLMLVRLMLIGYDYDIHYIENTGDIPHELTTNNQVFIFSYNKHSTIAVYSKNHGELAYFNPMGHDKRSE